MFWFINNCGVFEQKVDFSVYMTHQMDKYLPDTIVWAETEKMMCPSWTEMPGMRKREKFADASMT